MRMSEHAARRNHWDADKEFPDNMKALLDAYDDAARTAELRARMAVRDGGLEAMRVAQWWETVAATMERCMEVMLDPDNHGEGFRMPDMPGFGA